MPTLLLVRHGQASFGKEDYDQLSDLGHRQAEIVTEALTRRSLEVPAIVCGSLLRQRDTAAPLARRLDLLPATDPGWNEYDMESIVAAHADAPPPDASVAGGGLSSRDFQAVLEAALTTWMSGPPPKPAPADASPHESWQTFRARVLAALEGAASELGSGQTGIAFTSGGVIATVCATLLDLGTPQLLRFNRVAVNTGITKLAVGSRGMSLISFNDHSHLEQVDPALISYR